jgi:predicted PurR-regulated permease PerM
MSAETNSQSEEVARAASQAPSDSVLLDRLYKLLAVLVVMAAIVFLRWAEAIFIPVTLALLLSYALTPVVAWLKRRARLHEAVGAALVLATILAALGFGFVALREDALDLLDTVPRAVQKLSSSLRATGQESSGAVAKLQTAASEIEKAANSAAAPPGSAPKPAPRPRPR